MCPLVSARVVHGYILGVWFYMAVLATVELNGISAYLIDYSENHCSKGQRLNKCDQQ